MGDHALQSRQSFLEEAETFLKKGDYEAALDLAGVRLKRTPGDLDARMAICRVRIEQGSVDEARGLLEEMEEILAGLARIYVWLGDICLKKGLREEARAFFERYRILNPASGASAEMSASLRVLADLHDTETETGTGTEAAGKAEETEVQEEEVPQAPADFQTVTLAELYLRQGHLQSAVETLEAVLLKDPSQEKAAVLLRDLKEGIRREEAVGRAAPVIAELSLWLDNIGRLRSNAG